MERVHVVAISGPIETCQWLLKDAIWGLTSWQQCAAECSKRKDCAVWEFLHAPFGAEMAKKLPKKMERQCTLFQDKNGLKCLIVSKTDCPHSFGTHAGTDTFPVKRLAGYRGCVA